MKYGIALELMLLGHVVRRGLGTPLIISGTAEKPNDRYYKAAKIADAFVRDTTGQVLIIKCNFNNMP